MWLTRFGSRTMASGATGVPASAHSPAIGQVSQIVRCWPCVCHAMATPAGSRPFSALPLVARLLAIDHLGLGGALLNNASFGTVETFLDLLTRLLPDKAPVRQLPSQISDDRLLGGIDIGRSVSAKIRS